MRRWAAVLIVLVAAILAAVGVSFLSRRAAGNAVPAQKRLEPDVSAVATGWEWAYSDGKRPVITVKARDFKQLKQPPAMDLTGVELKIYHREGAVFDRVRSEAARFSPGEGRLYSDGDVDIELALTGGDAGTEPVAEASDAPAPAAAITRIRSSGVSFDNKTGRADTDRPVTFQLAVGSGSAEGAVYDPQTQELRLKQAVKLRWNGRKPGRLPMDIEAGEMLYREKEGKVELYGYSRFSRGPLRIEAGPAVVTIEEGELRLVETTNAAGRDQRTGRQVEFGAAELTMVFMDDAQVQKITGQGQARLRNTVSSGTTRVDADRLELSFLPGQDSSELARAQAFGRGVAESIPEARAGVRPETRTLRSDSIEIVMRKGGEEIEEVRTHAPGSIDFTPNAPGQRQRHLEGERITIGYASRNQIQSFRAVRAATRTEPDPRVKNAAPRLTSSDDLMAQFDPATGKLLTLEQWGRFRYQEGDRRAQAERARVDEARQRTELADTARVWDSSGSTDAETIVFDDGAGTTQATGKVRTVRLADKTGDPPVRATAARMSTSDRNSRIRYEGAAVLWQGDNRVEGETIEIERRSGILLASGDVSTTLREAGKNAITLVRAASMIYRDKDRVVFYDGGVTMTRPQLRVRSRKLRAYLSGDASEEEATTVPGSALDRAFAEGAVEIVQQEPGRTRTSTSEQADYYVTEGRIALEGGAPQLKELVPGNLPTVTRGRRLTWFSASDRLIVDGAPAAPVESVLKKKK
jgi:lipopolysaccharide export system protein LptA